MDVEVLPPEYKNRITATTTDQELGLMATEISRKFILEECEEAGLSVKKLVETLMGGLDAKATKQQMLMDGSWSQSPALVDHATRLRAVQIGKDILGLDAPKKLQAEVSHEFGASPETMELVKGLIGGFIDAKIGIMGTITASLKVFSEGEEEIA